MKIYVGTGYNSYTHRQTQKIFKTRKEADDFVVGLTDPKVHMVSGKSFFDAVNKLLD